MKLLFVSFITLMVSTHARAVTVAIGKPDMPIQHRCEVKSIEVETRYQNQPSRVVLSLRDSRGETLRSCPGSVSIIVDSREEAMKTYEMIRASTETTCLVTYTVTSSQCSKTCDAGFNAKVKM